MHHTEIPAASHIETVVATDAGELRSALRRATRERFYEFRYFAPIQGLPYSGRLVCNAQITGTVPFPRAMSPLEIASEFATILINDVRWPSDKGNEQKRAWSVYQALIRNEPVAIVYASWTT